MPIFNRYKVWEIESWDGAQTKFYYFFFSQKYLMDKARHYKPVSVVSRKVGQDRIEVALSA